MKGKKLTVDESIRIEAYLLSEKAGHPSGREHYFWKEAEAIVHARTKAVSVAVKKAAAKTAAKGKPAVKAKTPAKPKAAAKPRPAKKLALNGANGTDPQLSLTGETPPPGRKRTLRK